MTRYIAELCDVDSGDTKTTALVEADTDEEAWVKADAAAEELGLYVGTLTLGA